MSVLQCILVWSVAILQTTDGASITWYEPPPVETVTDDTFTFTSFKNLSKGSLNEELSFNFSLSADLSLSSITIELDGVAVAAYLSVIAAPSVRSPFIGRFNVSWVPTKLTLIVLNVTSADKGPYRCKVDCGGLGVLKQWKRTIEVDVFVQPNITYISPYQMADDGDVLRLICERDGNPRPRITWTRLSSNSVVSMPMNITGKQDEGVYRCTADNGIGIAATADVFVFVQSYRPFNTVFLANLTNATLLNKTFYLMCSAEANPAAKFTLYKKDESLGNFTAGSQNISLIPTSVNERVKEVTYKCIPFNSFGDGPTKTTTVTVHYNPDTVSLVANTTENTNCSDLLWINFTCEASEANPPVQSYHLLKNGELLDTASNGTWAREVSETGKHVYSCRAWHSLGNVNSSNSLIVTFNVRAQLSVNVTSGSLVLTEGGNLSLCCSAYAYPNASVTWLKLEANATTEFSNNCLDFTNIGRNASGNYICIANNACGKRNSSSQFIDVQFAPENAALSTNLSATQRICAGMVVNFTCIVGATNPAMDTFTLYENISVVSSKRDSGVWIRALNSGGEVSYKLL